MTKARYKTLILALSLAVSAFAADWRLALPGWQYEFPLDHEPHDDFRTEWWYFTGNLQDSAARRFGYELTFFRQGMRPPADRAATKSKLIVNDLPFAHFAISDPHGNRFLYWEKINRAAFGEAGFGDGKRLAWIENWSLEFDDPRTFHLHASEGANSIDLTLENVKTSWAVHGLEGVSQKAVGEGHASHYYSGTRLRTHGTLVLDGAHFDISGESWFDHEWATNQLTPEQAGWDWFSFQFDDQTEVMLYQMRLRNGSSDPESSGTFIDQSGQTQHLTRDDYQLTPLRYWTSKKTGARYPSAWQLQIPRLAITAEITTPLADQELSLPSLAYWEGLIDIRGTRANRPLAGRGYMEMTGYASALTGLSDPSRAPTSNGGK
ncbi:MAG TPA: lipocalin-like domain-containing protein [Chthoniobacteraceae bacterium]|jgi:predicted secreted hydrolase